MVRVVAVMLVVVAVEESRWCVCVCVCKGAEDEAEEEEEEEVEEVEVSRVGGEEDKSLVLVDEGAISTRLVVEVRRSRCGRV